MPVTPRGIGFASEIADEDEMASNITSSGVFNRCLNKYAINYNDNSVYTGVAGTSVSTGIPDELWINPLEPNKIWP